MVFCEIPDAVLLDQDLLERVDEWSKLHTQIPLLTWVHSMIIFLYAIQNQGDALLDLVEEEAADEAVFGDDAYG